MKGFKKFINENPDRVDAHTWWKQIEARAFGYIGGKFFISNNVTNHPDYAEKLVVNNKIKVSDLPSGSIKNGSLYVDRNSFKFPGRLWLKKKILSFWKYPDKNDFDKLIDDLKKNGVNIDSTWKVDIATTETKGEAKLVPISDYTDKFKSIKVKQVDHVMDPITKNMIKKATGSSSITYDKGIQLPKNMSFAEYRALTMKSESTSTVAPTSVATGQFQDKIGEPEKREDGLKDKIKKKIKKKWNGEQN